MNYRDPASGDDSLDAWKNIAHYLNVTVRTAQRWANERPNPLPVHRGRTVAARKSELDSWLAAKQTKPEAAQKRWRPGSSVYVAVSGLLIATVSIFLFFRPRPAPASVTLGRLMVSSSSEGRSLRRFPLPGPGTDMALSPSGDQVFACSHYSRDLYVLDVATGRTGTIPLPVDCGPLITIPDGRLFVGSAVDGITIVDGAARKVNPKRIETGGPVYAMAPTPDGGNIFIAMGSRGLKRLSTFSGRLESLSDLPCPEAVAVDPAGKLVYVSYQCKGPSGAPGQDSVEIIDVSTERRVGIINGLPMVGSPVSFSPDGSRVVLNGGDACSSPDYKFQGCRAAPSSISHLVSTGDRRVLGTWELPPLSGGLFYAGASRLVALARPMKVLDSASGVVLEELDLGDVRGLLPDPARHRVWVLVDSSLVMLDSEDPVCAPPLPGLAMYFSGDGALQDPVSLNVLSQTGTVGFAPGLSGQAFRLAGGSFRTGPRTGHLTVLERDWTLSLDIRFSARGNSGSTGPETLLDWTRRAPEAGIRLSRTVDDRLLFESWPDGAPLRTPNSIQPESWARVTVTRTDQNLTLYVNGESISAGMPARRIEEHLEMPLVLGTTATVGSGKDRRSFHGLLDEVVFYEKALSATEIRQRFRSSRFGKCAANLPPDWPR